MLGGLAFVSHQLGSFAGAFGGGLIFDRLGSYTLAWQAGVALGLAAGLVQLLSAHGRGCPASRRRRAPERRTSLKSIQANRHAPHRHPRLPGRPARAHRRRVGLVWARAAGPWRLDSAPGPAGSGGDRGRHPALAARGPGHGANHRRQLPAAQPGAAPGRPAAGPAGGPRLHAAAWPAGGRVGGAQERDCLLRPGRPPGCGALAERAGPSAGPCARPGPVVRRPPGAHLPDRRAPDLPHRFGRPGGPAVPADGTLGRAVGAGLVGDAVQRAAPAPA